MLSDEKKYEKLLQQFISGVECTINVDYGNKASVKKNNKGTDQYRKAAKLINEQFVDNHKKEHFAKFLSHPTAEIRINCAVCMIELMDYSEEWRMKALEIIKAEYPQKPLFEKSMINIWLKEQGFDEIEKTF